MPFKKRNNAEIIELQCSDCCEVLPIEEFRGNYTFCRQCYNFRHGKKAAARMKEWKKLNPEKTAEFSRKYRRKAERCNRCVWCNAKFSIIYKNRYQNNQIICERNKCVRCYLAEYIQRSFRYLGRPDVCRLDFERLKSASGLAELIDLMPHNPALRYPDALLKRTIGYRKDIGLAFKLSNFYWQPATSLRQKRQPGLAIVDKKIKLESCSAA